MGFMWHGTFFQSLQNSNNLSNFSFGNPSIQLFSFTVLSSMVHIRIPALPSFCPKRSEKNVLVYSLNKFRFRYFLTCASSPGVGMGSGIRNCFLDHTLVALIPLVFMISRDLLTEFRMLM